ncbi:helix-turn-helix transcriptional regulator [Lentisphaerota bacterium ZTH]|nr:helix-turn-helix transcriptional regulator [Lentisphaerota bacterium]WET06417.1 helix-turn-helix transcriptional regulator [Lentisphaerota bacterium ZTH]
MKTKNISKETNLYDCPYLMSTKETHDIVFDIHKHEAGVEPYFHYHERTLLLHAVKGVMTVNSSKGIWVVPPMRAVWIPAGTPHFAEYSRGLVLCGAMLKPELCENMPKQCCVVSVSPLLRELLLHAASIPLSKLSSGHARKVITLILDMLETLETRPLKLPMPVDPRLRKICNILINNPANNQTLEQLSKGAGASSRTAARHFNTETNMTFTKWRQQLRLLEALKKLAEGSQVKEVALQTGYESTSAFINMFKNALGVTPRQYFHKK